MGSGGRGPGQAGSVTVLCSATALTSDQESGVVGGATQVLQVGRDGKAAA